MKRKQSIIVKVWNKGIHIVEAVLIGLAIWGALWLGWHFMEGLEREQLEHNKKIIQYQDKYIKGV